MKSCKGFTLIEVMVALSIFAIAGAAVLKATQENLRAISTIQDVTFATWVANNQMTEAVLLSTVKWPLKNDEKGQTAMANKTWYWQQKISKTQDTGLFQLTIIVALDESMNNEVTAVTSFIAKPSE